MTLIRTGQGVTDIRGGTGGVYFTRDRYGLHQSAKPRNIHRRSTAQDKQRKCFTKARTYSTDNRTVSYLIYRCLNDLPFLFDVTATGNPVPDCTGIYVKVGEILGINYYSRTDGAYFLWCKIPPDVWFISTELGVYGTNYWYTTTGFISYYDPYGEATGRVRISLELRPPPVDYQIPKL